MCMWLSLEKLQYFMLLFWSFIKLIYQKLETQVVLLDILQVQNQA